MPSYAPNYYLSYYVYFPKSGATPFGHSALAFSKQNHPEDPICVEDAYGFYSQSSTTKNVCIKGIKKIINMNVDLQHTHAVLKKETISYLDKFDGLKGLNFKVSEEEYYRVLKKCKSTIEAQQVVIEELNGKLLEKHPNLKEKEKKKLANGHTRYQLERNLALERLNNPQNTSESLLRKEMRLKPFHLEIKYDIERGIDTSESSTCKGLMLDILLEEKIINQDLFNKLKGSRAKNAFPHGSHILFSPIVFMSTGPLGIDEKQSKRMKKIVFNRRWENTDNQLFWTHLPPLYLGETYLAQREEALHHQGRLKPLFVKIRKLELELKYYISKLENNERVNAYHLESHLKSLELVRSTFIQPSTFVMDDKFNAALLKTKQTYHKAQCAFLHARSHYPFILMMLETAAIRNSLLLLGLTLLIAPFIHPLVGTVAVLGAAYYATKNIYQSHRLFKEMQKDSLPEERLPTRECNGRWIALQG